MEVHAIRRNQIVTGIWMLITASIPFLQGGYFYVTSIGLSLLCMCLYMYSPHKVVLPTYMKFYMLLFGAAVITLTVAVDKGMHLLFIMKLTLPISLWLSTESLSSTIGWKKVKKAMGIIVLLWSVGLTLPFILGVLLSMEFFIQNSRFGGFFQYANSYGAFLCGLLSYWLLPLPSFKLSSRKVRGVAIVFLIAAIALTQSRGIYAITGAIICIHMLVYRKNWALIGVGLLLGWGLLVVVGADDIARGADVVSNNSEWLSRIVYYIDGLKMLRDHPMGTGHLGFYYLQGSYQTAALYQIRYLHGSLLQILLDTGIIGGISWMLMMVFPLWIGVLNREKLPFICGISLVLLHTLIDFDMQFSAMWVLWYIGMYGIQDRYEQHQNMEEVVSVSVKRRIGVGVSIMVLGYFTWVTGLEYTGYDYQAVTYYPGYTKAASAVVTEQTADTVSYEDRKEVAENGIRRNPYFYDGFAFLRKYYYNNGDLKKSIDEAHNVVELKPLHMRNLETYMVRMLEYLLNREVKGALSKDHPYFREIFGMEAYLDRLKERKDYRFTIQHEVTFEWTPRMQRIVTITRNLYDRVELE